MRSHDSNLWLSCMRQHIVIALVGIVAVPATRAADPGIDGRSVRIENVTQESATVGWTTALPATTQVMLVDNEGGFQKRFPDPKGDTSPGTTKHKATITGLLPGKKYQCVVVSAGEDGIGCRYPPASGKPSTLPFETKPFDEAAPTRFRIDILGPANVYAGSDLYLAIYPVPLAGKKKMLDLTQVTFDPPAPSITPHLISNWQNLDEKLDFVTNPETKKPSALEGLSGYVYSPVHCPKLRLRTGATTEPGSYTVTLTMTSSGVSVVANHAFNVLPAPAAVRRTPVDTVKPIPGLAVWKERMVLDGKRFGKRGETIGFGYEGHVWFYDGGRVFLQIGDYLQDKPTWVPRAQNILLQYADYVRIGSTGWRIFPHGLAMYYWRYGDERAKSGLLKMAKQWGPYGGAPDPEWQRETAYILNTLVKAAQVGEPEHFRTKVLVDYVLGHADLVCRHGHFEQPFYDGLTMEALIGWYEYTAAKGTPDHRVPPVVKKMLDWLWENAVDKKTGQMLYQVQAFDGYSSSSRLGPKTTELNNLVTPAYAWYWNLTGDNTYLDRGDFLFGHSVDESRNGFWSGKQFSQNYKASFDYVHYRSSATPVRSLSDPSNNPRDTTYKPESTPPVISDIRVTRKGDDVTICWTTDKPCNTQVRYGTALKNGEDFKHVPAFPADITDIATDKPRAVTAHAVTITGLPASKPDLRFSVLSRDLLGNLAVSAEQKLVPTP